MASISRDVRRTACEVVQQGSRIGANVDLLRGQILARLASIETSLASLAGTPITAADINGASDHQFVIFEPGHYCLAENVVAQARFGFFPIVVVASDVVLDLGSFVLESFPGGTAFTMPDAGILVAGPNQNVTVRNGTIRGFAQSVLIMDADLVTLEALRLTQWSSHPTYKQFQNLPHVSYGQAVFAHSSSNLTISESSLDQGGSGGILAVSVQGLQVRDCLIANLTPLPFPMSSGPTDVILGLAVQDFETSGPPSSNLTVQRVIVEHLLRAAPTRPDVTSSSIIGVDLVTFVNDATVFQRNLLLEDVVVQDVRDAPDALSSTVGFVLLGGFDQAVPSDLANAGPRGSVMRRCVARDMHVGSAPTALRESDLFGIIAEGESLVIEDCAVQFLTYVGPPEGNVAADGFIVHNRGVRMSRNVVTGIDTRAASRPSMGVAVAVGIATCPCGIVGGLVEQNYVSDVHGVPNADFPSTGFFIIDNRNTEYRQNVASTNTIGFVVTDQAGPPFSSFANVFDSNTAIGNDLQGFLDRTPSAAKNAYLNNFARSNGGGNYVGLPPGTPIAQWTIGTAPPPTDKLSNLSVSP